jgi:hypothetical protein
MNFLPNPSADYNQYKPLIPEDMIKGLAAGAIGAGLSSLGVGGSDGSPVGGVPAPSSSGVAPTPSLGSQFVNGLNSYSNNMMSGGKPQTTTQSTDQSNTNDPINSFVNRIVPFSNNSQK